MLLNYKRKKTRIPNKSEKSMKNEKKKSWKGYLEESQIRSF